MEIRASIDEGQSSHYEIIISRFPQACLETSKKMPILAMYRQ